MENSIHIDNRGTFVGGYFVLRKAALKTPPPSLGELLITCPPYTTILDEVLHQIAAANHYVKICSFVLEDRQVVNALKEKLHQNIPVFVLTSVDDRKFMPSRFTEEEADPNLHLEILDTLAHNGAHIHACVRAHSKFLICDGREGIIMSANITDLSLRLNPESGIRLRQGPTLEDLEQLFDSIFRFGSEYIRFDRLGTLQTIQKRETEIYKSYLPKAGASDLRFTYEQMEANLLQEIESLVASASKEVILSTYSIVFVERLEGLLKKFKEFIARGGRIQILARGMNHRPDHLAGCMQLQALGMEIYGDLHNHSKGMVADGKHHLLFTANLDGQFGLDKGFEVGIRFGQATSEGQGLEAFIRWQIATSPFVFKRDPSKIELFEYYQYCYDRKQISPYSLPKHAILFIRGQDWPNEFKDGVRDHPLFVSLIDRHKGLFQLKSNGKCYKLQSQPESRFEFLGPSKEANRQSTQIWAYESLNLLCE